jgi:prophage regulatory protein
MTTSLLRIKQIVGCKKTGIPALIPVSESTWWAGVKAGRFPAAVKIGKRITCWRESDLRKLMNGDTLAPA